MSRKPPLELHAEVTDADGARTRWDPGDKDARYRPSGFSFTTARMSGFETGECTIHRRFDHTDSDLALLNDLVFVGADGEVAYEGRMVALPRSGGGGDTVAVQSAGYMGHTADRKFSGIYIDRDLSRWQGPGTTRRATLLAANRTADTGASAPDAASGVPALHQRFTGAWAATGLPNVENWYDAGPGNVIGEVRYAWRRIGTTIDNTNVSWDWRVLLEETDDIVGASLADSGNLRAAGPASGTLSYAGDDARYATARLRWTGGAGGADHEYDLAWTRLAVIGAHGLTLTGDDAATQGFTASQVIRDVIGRYAPMLSTVGVQDTTYPIPHLTFPERTDPYEAIKRVNAYHLWNVAVWENKTLHFEPVDLTDYDWQVRKDEVGVSWSGQGDTVEDLYNGVEIEFTNLQTGAKDLITPDDDPTLADTDPGNPANRWGLPKWATLQLSFPTLPDAAAQIGRAVLGEFTTPKAAGTITVRGHIRDRSGTWHQGWKVRAGQTVAITDHPNDRPRLIESTRWDQDSKTLTLTLEGQPHRMEAVFDRIGTSLSAAGLG